MRSYGSARLFPVLLLFLVLAGCGVAPGSLPTEKTVLGEGVDFNAGARTAQSADCPVTTPTVATPPDSRYRSPLPTGAYYVSADRGIWTSTDVWGLGSRKVGWIKPEGSTLIVRGRRLDGDAAPLWADISEGYVGDFQSSRLIIPSAGCWEIEARANESLLRFVVYVPQRPKIGDGPTCDSIGEVVRPNRIVIAGHVESSFVDASGRWAWQSVLVTRNLYPYSLYREAVSVGRTITILQDTAREPPRAEGAEYVLVLHGDPWQVACPQQTVAAVDHTQVAARIEPMAPDQALWAGTTLPEIKEEIASAHRRARVARLAQVANLRYRSLGIYLVLVSECSMDSCGDLR